eukprot:CAMPEP_0177496444 /NCGR_PEP_ID=MMETSP0369-20130122/34509_1 /TAXON_ID=447022 ORGANISM="Scrippsiella hangoei-like, Strain SHHI-4" /NCGR_SAMPLE_ID=MMETSP0369 /ASSEMBLY_ACC=CAM_ASM_000364 /LENGTH=79 /DNA_ID=CAMNT_0018973513 /DNA_START=1423 /DNA_END=1662 /DNA_ORIENTATION=-
MTHFAIPAMPAWASVCPKLILLVVNAKGRVPSGRFPRAAIIAPISIGSPRAVPVPWHSAAPTKSGVTFAIRIDILITEV